MTEDEVRTVVREEIASLAGKALRRSQDQELTRSPDRNMMVDIANRELAQFWGEVLAEYSKNFPPEKVAELVGGDVIEDGEGNAVGFTLPKGRS
jgi:hypothetical protein